MGWGEGSASHVVKGMDIEGGKMAAKTGCPTSHVEKPEDCCVSRTGDLSLLTMDSP